MRPQLVEHGGLGIIQGVTLECAQVVAKVRIRIGADNHSIDAGAGADPLHRRARKQRIIIDAGLATKPEQNPFDKGLADDHTHSLFSGERKYPALGLIVRTLPPPYSAVGSVGHAFTVPSDSMPST